jgi:hypothetical protein
MIGRWLDKLPRKLGLGLMIGVGVVGLSVLGLGAWFIIEGGAPGGLHRYELVILCAVVLQRFSAKNSLKPSITKRLIDVLSSASLAICVLWYVRTGSPLAFGLPALFWFVGAYAIGWGAGFVAERLHGKRAMSASN